MPQVRVRYPLLGGRLTPYALAGVGVAFTEFNDRKPPGYDVAVETPGTVLVGTIDEICDTLVQRREQWGVSYVVVGDDLFEAFAPVVARLAGT